MRKLFVGFGLLACLAGAFLFVSGAKAPRDKSAALLGAARSARSTKDILVGTVPPSPKMENSTELLRKYGQLPLSFEPNVGQVNTKARFLAHGNGYEVLLAPTEMTLGLRAGAHSATNALRMQLLGANPSSAFNAVDRLPGTSNYLIGNDPEQWHTNIPTFRKVQENAVYPGIDLTYHASQRQLEYDFAVAPGVDPGRIRFRLRGADAVRIEKSGDLITSVAGSEIRFHKPVAYQGELSARRTVDVAYSLGSGQTVTFKLGNVDPKQTLIIDPILSYSTYLGGSNIDGANGIAVAPDGTAFVAGGTFSTDFPTAHPLQPNHGGPDDFYRDAFVAKLSADGSTLLYSTYLGGKNEDVANGIAVDAAGDAYVTGTTDSPDFPVTFGSFNTLCGGDGECGASWNPTNLIVSNGFVVKLNPAGSGLIYSGFVGYYEIVRSQAIAVDNNENAYITGETGPNLAVTVTLDPQTPPPPPFPITAGAFQSVIGGDTDAFVMKISATGSTILNSSYLGGNDEDVGDGIAVDSSANAYVTGLTYSTNFPTAAPLQATYGGAGDAFLAKVNTSTAAATSLLYSTYLGGSGLDQGNGVTVDSGANVYVAGGTASTTLPATAGVFQPTCHLDTSNVCEGDAFVAKFTPAGAGLSLGYLTYLGGSLADSATGIAIDPVNPPDGFVYVTGATVSPNFPVTASVFQPTYGGGNDDAFVAKLDPLGATLVYSSYLGGTNTDIGYGIAADVNGNSYVAGQTCSLNFPLANPEQGTPGGDCDAFVSKVSILNGIQVNPAGLVFSAQSLGTTSQPQAITITNGDSTVTLSPIAVSPTSPNPGDFAVTSTCPTSLAPGTQCKISVTFTPGGSGLRMASIPITANATAFSQNVVISLNGQASTLTLSASTLTFPSQQVGTTSANPMAVTATNNGTTAVTFTSITASGDFAETDNCTKAPVQPSTNCVINVSFTPSAAGLGIGALTLSDNAPGSPQVVILTGTGVGQQSDFSMSETTPSASVPAGQAAPVGLSISSFGGFNQPVTLSCSGLPADATCQALTNPITPSGSATPDTVTIVTSARTMLPPSPANRTWPRFPIVPFMIACLAMLLLLATTMFRGPRQATFAALGVLLVVIMFSASCNGGSAANIPPGTPAGTYQVVITGTSGNLSHSVDFTLQVK